MDKKLIIRQELLHAHDVLEKFINDPENIAAIENAADLIASSIKNGGKAISCGNGGSHCDAMHFAEELTGRFRDNRNPLPAVAISDPGYITCVGNDFGFEHIFSRFVQAMANKNDVLIAISTSGNSKNVIKAIEAAHANGAKVVALTGNGGGNMSGMADVEIRVPHFGYADRVQEIHIKVIHILILLIEKLV
ncbi:MAG TPA: D-sedoheptulose 7-phosphate isomerase [Fulvivirga sp.]|nr:D-sedoheptulose 7-phosphate isomerase [Fulvivirga sp.]